MLPRGLPPELLLLILSYIHDYRDLHSLCLTCRAVRKVAETILYQSIRTQGTTRRRYYYPKLPVLDDAMHAKLYKTIRSRGFADIVTDFRITFPGCQHWPYLWQPNRIWRRCTCDKFDAMLSQVMLSLQNLQTLYFQCRCCVLVIAI